MIRALLSLAVLAVVAWAVTSVPLGSRTLWGHLSAIWSTPEAKEMQAGIKEAAEPAIEKVRRGAEAGLKAAKEPAPDAATLPHAEAMPDATQLWRAAQDAGERGRHGEAAALAERAFAADTSLAAAAMFAVVSYCKAEQKIGARRMAKELGATARKTAAVACSAKGIALDGR
ncbi:MAG: hypothetical protein IPL79_13835 [Myxococcales bacterium]|nr:hypothetical protein [Myxococcales bacterium]